MPNFSPDQCTFGDVIGYGAWDVGHAREHDQFVTKLAALTPAILIPSFNLLNLLTAGGSRKAQMEAHQTAHELLGGVAGITAVDFAEVNLDDQAGFYNFLGLHATTHQQLRQFLGIT